jgi:hypothetical protein
LYRYSVVLAQLLVTYNPNRPYAALPGVHEHASLRSLEFSLREARADRDVVPIPIRRTIFSAEEPAVVILSCMAGKKMPTYLIAGSEEAEEQKSHDLRELNPLLYRLSPQLIT